MSQPARTSAVAGAMLLVTLAMALSSLPDWISSAKEPGIDFYQFWGLAKCERDSGFRLGSPYAHRAEYQQRLVRLAAASGDANLQAVVTYREQPDTTGTPLSYALIGSLPGPYSLALQLWRVSLVLAFLATGLALAWPLARPAVALAFALAAAVACDPLLLDARVGNLTSFELAGLVGCAEWIRRGRDARARALLAPAALVLLMLMKPTVGFAAALLGLCVLARVSWPLRAAAIASATLTIGLLVLPPVMLFGSTSVWGDWLGGIFGSSARLAYGIESGNYSGVAWIAALTGSSIGAAMLVVAAAMGVSKLVAFGASPRTAWRAGAEMLRDPLCALSAGVIVLFALSPLVWSHYQVLAIAPALWLAGAGESRWARILGWCALVLVCDPLRRLVPFVPVPLTLVDAVHALNWLPLWIGLLLVLRARARTDVPQPVVAIAPFMTPS